MTELSKYKQSLKNVNTNYLAMLKYPSVLQNELNTPKKVYFSILEETKVDINLGHIKWSEYITIVFIILFGNLELLTDYLKLCLIHGGTKFMIMFIVLYLIIGLPLTSLNLFLGHFCKCGFFRLWSISPIYRGVGYTIAILGLLSIILSSVITSTSLLYMMNLLREEIPWLNCNNLQINTDNNRTQCINYKYLKHIYVNNDVCCPYLNTKRMCTSSTASNILDNPTFSVSSLLYFRNQISHYNLISKLDNSLKVAFQFMAIELIACLAFTWFITIIVSSIGLNTTKSLTRKLGTIAVITLIICFIMTIIIDIPQNRIKMDDTDYSFWDIETFSLIRIISSIYGRSLPLNIVCLGARAPHTTIPTIDALLTTIAYLLMLIMFTYWTTIKIGAVRYKIQLKNVHCISRSGSEALLALIPDLIVQYFPLNSLFAFLYYCSIYTLGLLAQIIFITGVLDSIEDIKPAFHHYRLQFCILLCGLSLLCSLILTTPIQYIIIESWYFFARHLVILIVITLYGTAVIWIYGANRLQTDIDFMYKIKLSMTFWIICWKCFPFVAVTVLIYIIYKLPQLYGFIVDQFYMQQICGILSFIILLPIPCTAIYYYFRNIRFVVTNNATSLFENNAQWGPPDTEIRRARNRFNPKYEKRFRAETQRCPHSLINSKRLTSEVERLEANRKLFLEEIRKLQETVDGSSIRAADAAVISSVESLTQVY